MDTGNVMYAMHPENIGSGEAERSPDEIGAAAVYRLRIGSYLAECSCGWSAPRRLLKASACQDAWAHTAQRGCHLRLPLIHE
jgi:hypothetical protein